MHIKNPAALFCSLIVMCFFPVTNAAASSIKKLPGDSVTVGNYKISSAQFYTLTGKHLDFFQRMKLNLLNKQLKQEQNDKVLQKGPLFPRRRRRHKFNLGWFLLGLAGAALGIVVFAITFSWVLAFLSMLVPLTVAYITGQDDDKKASVRWGVGTGVLLLYIFLAILFAGFTGK